MSHSLNVFQLDRNDPAHADTFPMDDTLYKFNPLSTNPTKWSKTRLISDFHVQLPEFCRFLALLFFLRTMFLRNSFELNITDIKEFVDKNKKLYEQRNPLSRNSGTKRNYVKVSKRIKKK